MSPAWSPATKPPASTVRKTSATRSPAARRSQAGGNAPAQQEPQEGQREGDADEPPPQPVQPFPEEDRLEIRERHPGMDEAELRDLAVARELGLPGGLAERRQDA